MCVGQDRVLNIHAVFLSRQQRPGAHHVLRRPEGQVIIFLKRPSTMDNIFHSAAIDRHKYQIIQYAVCIRTSLSEGRPGNYKIYGRINLIGSKRNSRLFDPYCRYLCSVANRSKFVFQWQESAVDRDRYRTAGFGPDYLVPGGARPPRLTGINRKKKRASGPLFLFLRFPIQS